MPVKKAISGVGAAIVAAMFLVACTDEQASLPAAPSFAVVPDGCDMSEAVRSARRFFTDNGNNSLKSQAVDEIREMEGLCASGDDDGYTDGFFTVAGFIQTAIATGVNGAASDGDDLIWILINADEFDPCDGAPNCDPWDGHPNRPDFTSALSASGAWTVLTGGSSSVCSGHVYPCTNITPSSDGEAWGVEAPAGWGVSLHGLPSVLFGHPIPFSSPTGEAALATALPAYEWGLIPQPKKFGADLEVGLCSDAITGLDESLVQKRRTVLEQAVLDFCTVQQTANPPDGFFASIGQFFRGLVNPSPRELMAAAAVFRVGPGGSAGSFTPFFAIDLPVDATWVFLNQPADVTVGQTLQDALGQRIQVQAVTTSQESPLERALAIVTVKNNNGLVPSGGVITSATLTCDAATGVCTGFTQADEDPNPGVLEVLIEISKTGGYELCVTGVLEPLQFPDEVCTAKFNVTPDN